jgi:hypothetical protein
LEYQLHALSKTAHSLAIQMDKIYSIKNDFARRRLGQSETEPSSCALSAAALTDQSKDVTLIH